MKSLVKDFDKKEFSLEQLNKILDKLEEGHSFIKQWRRDKKNFLFLKTNPVFHGCINEDKRGWVTFHNFPITLEILNKEITPGGEVVIHSFGGEKKDLLVYHALCPELENFVSLIVWIDTKSSMQAWKHIVELIGLEDEKKTLQFSPKCGIELPNTIHPSNDMDSKLVTKDLYESLYDWKFAHYLYDDGRSIMSHISPLNFRRVILDEWTRDESFVNIRTTIGRLQSIQKDSVKVSIPSLSGESKFYEWKISQKINKESLEINKLYFFQIYRSTGNENIETHVRDMYEAAVVDIIGMFLANSLYLLYLGKMRLKLLNTKQFEKLFGIFYDQVSRFCFRNNSELDGMTQLNWKTIQLGYTNNFTQWIDSDLYVTTPLLRRFLSNYDLKTKDKIIQILDKSFEEKNHTCFTGIIYDDNGNRLFSRQEMGKIQKIYDFVNFLINEKRFVLGIGQNFVYPHQRDGEIEWLTNQIKMPISN